MAEEKILTLHPDKGKQGVNISKRKYDTIRKTIIAVLKKNGGIGFMDMNGKVEDKLAGKFEGSIGWYTVTVKLDMEARGEINCDRSKGKQKLYLEI